MLLLWRHPKWASRSCEECKRWVYDDQGDKVLKTQQDPETGRFLPLPMARPPGSPLECARCPKIPVSEYPHYDPRRAPEVACEMDAQCWQIYHHYQECKAVGHFPEDPLVRRHAGIIRGVEEAVAHADIRSRLDMIVALLSGGNHG